MTIAKNPRGGRDAPLHSMLYNFVRIHRTLRVAPPMEEGVSDHAWSIAEIVGLLHAAEKKSGVDCEAVVVK